MQQGRVRVVRVIARMNVGGPAFHTMHLTRGLEERYPTVLVTGDVDEGEADMRDQAVERGVRVHRIPELGRRLSPGQDLVALAKLVRLLRRLRPEIVHTHTAKAGTLGRIAAMLAGVPVRVHTFHGHVFEGYFGRGVARTFMAIERALAKVTTCVVAISPRQAEDLTVRYRVSLPEQTRVVPLGLELDRFAPGAGSRAAGTALRREFGMDESTPLVTIVGRLAPIKNHDLFLSAAAELTRRGRDCRFLIVGGGSEENRLRQATESLGLGGRITFAGWRSDLEAIYAASDVVVLTSFNEGTPVCLIEALSAGRAVVSTDVGGVHDVLEGGELGLIVPSGDRDALAAAIERLLDDPALRAELGRRGAAVAPVRYGVGRLLRDVEGLYDELLGRSPSRAERLDLQRA